MTGAVWNCTEILTQIDFVKELVYVVDINPHCFQKDYCKSP